MEWQSYWSILKRRWTIIVVILFLDLLGSALLYAKSSKTAGYQSCTTLYVADVSAPTMVTAPQTTLEGLGQLLAGETAANFFADDIVDVAQSQHVARFVSQSLAGSNLPHTSEGDISGAVSGSRRDRTVNLCVTNPDQNAALAAAKYVAVAMTSQRTHFLGAKIGGRTYVAVVSDPSVAAAPVGSARRNFLLRIFLGLLLAVGLALLWDALDPRVRGLQDVEESLGVPVLASSRV
jgi:capsular polysaccharide biosynthesis protein